VRRDEIEPVLRAALEASLEVQRGLDAARVSAEAEAPALGPLPESGVGAARALAELVRRAEGRAVASAGPRYFHYVVGGVTGATLAADWFASALDQVASSATGSPLAVDLEEAATRWLAELFGLDPGAWTGVCTTGATTASLVGLGAARQWWGERLGVDVGEEGLAGLPRPAVLTGGFAHASVIKSLSMLGIGRASCERLSLDNRGTLDVDKLERRLASMGDQPAIVVATAGEVNSGRFDPLAAMADLCERYGAWLHVDAAFGLFARVAPEVADLAQGIERADSIAADAHKWLNVPYDSGFALVKQRALMAKTFRLVAAYLPPSTADGPRPRVPANLGPESSRRARALPIFAALLSEGRAGIRAMVEGHLRLADHLRNLVSGAPDLELVDDTRLNVVPFRFVPACVRRRDLDELNQRLGERVLEDGRVFVGTTRYRSVVCLRPAIANWRTRAEDVELLVEVVRELGAGLVGGGSAPPSRSPRP
jgi:glutamate/tyrosine decarboxylase-like PLP-dependent enzyme